MLADGRKDGGRRRRQRRWQRRQRQQRRWAAALASLVLACCTLVPCACSADSEPAREPNAGSGKLEVKNDLLLPEVPGEGEGASDAAEAPAAPESSPAPSAEELRASLGIVEDYRAGFDHGEKGPAHQKYIMLHDTEGESGPRDVVDFWDGNGNLVAAHFVVGKDGSIVQCVPLDRIAHHAGFGDTGHNALYGVEDESRDDRLGTVSIGSWASDYGMNSFSIGIEMVHVGGSGEYPEAQLEALDALIAYIDAYYGFESQIIDHKAWRSGNSDTSPEFAAYLANYQTARTHDGV